MASREISSESPKLGALLVELVDHVDAMIAYWDADQVCVFANAAYRDWFGKGRAELIGTTLEALLGPLYLKNLPYIEAAYAGQKQVFEREIPNAQGGVRHSLATYTPRWVDGEVRGIFVHVADVGPLKRLEQQLVLAKERAEQRANHDFLTGLPNRSLLQETLARELAVAAGSHGVVALLTIDVDHFKAVNDAHGHLEGDRYLVEMSMRIRRSVRSCDAVLRIGGDEFIVVVAAVPPARVEVLAERILQMARQPFLIGNADLTPTLSIGAALFPTHGRTVEALVVASDRALYAAKKAGRNCFVVDDDRPWAQGAPPPR